MNTKEETTIVEYNPYNKKITNKELCPLVCAYKYEVMDKIATILDNPDYDCTEDWCTLIKECEKDARRRCIVEVVKNLDL